MMPCRAPSFRDGHSPGLAAAPTRTSKRLNSCRAVGTGEEGARPDDLERRIASGQFSKKGSRKERFTRPARKLLSKDPIGPGRWLAKKLADAGLEWSRRAATRMPEASGDIREILGQPVFVPLFSLFRVYGPIFKLSFGPQSFVVISDPAMAKQVLMTNATKYSKGMLSEILDFVMGTGLIPADGEVWKIRRRKIVPSLHKRYIESMVSMFGASAEHCIHNLQPAADADNTVDMENYYSRLALDIIGKAVFNYDFDSLTKDDPIIRAVYTTLRESEHRSMTPLPYWNLPFADSLVPRQKRNKEALKLVNDTLNELIAESKALWESEAAQSVSFEENTFLSRSDPSILHFLIASGDDITSKQLRDDLMTLLIAGHETTAAVLTWTTYLLATHPDSQRKIQAEVDEVIGDARPTLENIRQLQYTMRVINESMRLYPQPPVLIRRALESDVIGGYHIAPGTDMFISVWNLHHSPSLWDEPDAFRPERFGPLDKIPNEATTDFAYLPFGGGRRKCIGDQFALFESVVALAMLQRRFSFELDPEAPAVSMTTGATIHTTAGMNVKLRPRVLSDIESSGGGDVGSDAAAAAEHVVSAPHLAAKGNGAVGAEHAEHVAHVNGAACGAPDGAEHVAHANRESNGAALNGAMLKPVVAGSRSAREEEEAVASPR